MIRWFKDIWDAVFTVAQGMWVTLRYWIITYEPERGTFTHKYEYPEKPVPVASRYRGFHRYDLTTCIAFKITGFTIDYSKCMFCALCVEPCPVDCIFMGASHDLSCYSRDGCMVDFARLPLDVAWGRSTINPTAVAESKVIVEPVHGGPNQ
jgi:NADH-quinone oxidoreductase subunit I